MVMPVGMPTLTRVLMLVFMLNLWLILVDMAVLLFQSIHLLSEHPVGKDD